MFEQIVREELPDTWEYEEVEADDEITVDDQDDDAPTNQHDVAHHESGATIQFVTLGDRVIVNGTQPVEIDGYRAYPAVHARFFDDDQEAYAYVREVAEDIDDGEDVVEGLAVVAHEGTAESVDLDQLDESEPRDPDQHGVADVFVARPSQLPDDLSIEDLREQRRSLVELTYGERDDVPDVIHEVGENADDYQRATIEVFTVAMPTDLELADD